MEMYSPDQGRRQSLDNIVQHATAINNFCINC